MPRFAQRLWAALETDETYPRLPDEMAYLLLVLVVGLSAAFFYVRIFVFTRPWVSP